MCEFVKYIGLLWNMSVYNKYLFEMEECSDAAGMYYEQVKFCVRVCLCAYRAVCVCVCVRACVNRTDNM